VTIQPKPGPHLAVAPTPVSPPPIKRSFRDLARMHALMAADYMAEAQRIEPDLKAERDDAKTEGL